jgi:Zn-dependent protease
MATWGVIVFTSLFVHELGHALFGILWGSKATVILYPLGGITHMDPPLSRRRSIVSLLAGPFVNLMLGLCIAAVRAKTGSPAWLSIAMWVNLGWGALNLMPVLPFDGGRVLVEVLGERRAANALLVSASVATGIAFSGLIAFRSLGLAFVFSAAAFVSFMEWNRRRRAEALKLLIDLHARRGHLEQACRVALNNLGVLAPSDVRLVLEAAFADRSVAAATELASALASRTHCPDDVIAEAYGLSALGQDKQSRAVLAALLPPPKDWCPRQSSRNWLCELSTHSDIADKLLPELDRASR